MTDDREMDNDKAQKYRATAGPHDLKNLILRKWPEGLRPLGHCRERSFPTGVAALDALFPSGPGIPYGQLIEITGGVSSGKTSLLWRLITAGQGAGHTVAYVDCGGMFFPAVEVDLTRLLLLRAATGHRAASPTELLRSSLRSAELMLRDRRADLIAFDLIGQRHPLPLGLLHRLRLRTVRAKGLVIFLTESNDPRQPGIIPASMAALRLEVSRTERHERFRVVITKSRLCLEGVRLEVEW